VTLQDIDRVNAGAPAKKPATRLKQRVPLTIQRIVLNLSLLGVWELGSALSGSEFWISRPSLILERIVELSVTGELFRHLFATLAEAGIGLILAALVGIPIGIALERFTHVAKLVEPIIMGLYGLPRVALAPLFILWVGIGLSSKVLMSFSMVVFVFLMNVSEGVRSIDRDLLDLMSTMRAKRSFVIRRIILPAIVPWIITAVKIGVGLALIGAVVAELVGSNQGLGWYIEKSGGQLDTTGVFTGLFVLMAVAMFANFLIITAERRLLRWRGNTV
jgi:NitT/TauT family transport system permease protein